MEYDCIIIGAGVGGIFCALKLSLEGRKVLLLEKQPIPGGLATAFTRRGFTFESSLHCVDALSEGGEVREFLKESSLDKEIEFIELPDFARIVYPGHDFLADFSRDKLIAYLEKSFPSEAKGIRGLFLGFDRFYKEFDRFQESALPEWLKLALSPFFSRSVIMASISSTDQIISRHIKDKKLKSILADIWRFIGVAPKELSALYFLLVFRGYFCNRTAYVKGGFLNLFKAMVKKINECGSEARFNVKVKKILTAKGAACGVITEKGEEYRAKAVVSNANAIDTLLGLADDESLKRRYQKELPPLQKSISAFQVYLGLDVPTKDLGMARHIISVNAAYDHEENFQYCISGNYEKSVLLLTDHSQIDPSLAPPGKGTLLIITFDSYSNWSSLSKEQYASKKQEMAQRLVLRAEKYLPGLSGHIEIMEAATPLTISRFSLVPEGAIYGFAQTVAQSCANRLSQKTKIKGLFLAGAWTKPGGGFHGCFVSGVDAADMVENYLKRRKN